MKYNTIFIYDTYTYSMYNWSQAQGRTFYMIIKYINFPQQFVRGMFKKLARLVVRWHVKLDNWYTFGTLARLLTRWHIKMRSWHSFVTQTILAHIAHIARDLPNSHSLWESVNVNMKTAFNFYDMTTLRYLVIKEKFEQMCVIGPYFV